MFRPNLWHLGMVTEGYHSLHKRGPEGSEAPQYIGLETRRVESPPRVFLSSICQPVIFNQFDVLSFHTSSSPHHHDAWFFLSSYLQHVDVSFHMLVSPVHRITISSMFLIILRIFISRRYHPSHQLFVPLIYHPSSSLRLSSLTRSYHPSHQLFISSFGFRMM